jgi:hypothetical protein
MSMKAQIETLYASMAIDRLKHRRLNRVAVLTSECLDLLCVYG